MATARRRARHWKQRFDPEAKFVWARHVMFDGKRRKPGSQVDKRKFMIESPSGPGRLDEAKLRRLWRSRIIELADWRPSAKHNPHATPISEEAAERFTRTEEESVLLSSDVLPGVLEVGNIEVTLDELTRHTQVTSGLSEREWNDLPEEDRESRLRLMLDGLREDAEEAATPPEE